MSEIQAIWLLGSLALFLLALAGWAVSLARRATVIRQHLIAAVQDLGTGGVGGRLHEDEVGTEAAAAFNQMARNLDLQIEGTRHSVEHLRDLAASLSDRVLLALNDDAEVDEVLGGLEELTGHHVPLVIGRHASFFFASEAEWEKVQAAALAGEQEPLVVALRRQDGELYNGLAVLRRRADGQGHLALMPPPGVVVAGQNESPSEARFSAFAGALPDGLAVVADGVIVSVSPRFVAMAGADEGELVGRRLMDLVVPSDAVTTAALVSAVPDAAGAETELTFRRPHGQTVTLGVTVGCMEDEGSRLYLLSARDVSLSRGRRRRLEQSAAWLAAALEASEDGLAVLPAEGSRLAVANARFLEIMHLEPGRLPSAARLDAVLDRRFADGEGVRAFLAGRPDGEGGRLTTTFATQEQPARMLQLSRLPISAAPGRSLGILVVARDVSQDCQARERLMERLQKLETAAGTAREEGRRLAGERERLEEEAARLLKENGELLEREEMKTNMLGNFTHEMQNPLVSIRGYNEMMLRGDLGEITEEQRQGLDIALRNAKRLAGLVEQLMIFARTEDALTELTLEAFPVWVLLEENIALLGDRVKEKNLKVTTRYDTQRLSVLADRNLTSQVFSNVLGNAVKYSRDGGEIAVTVRPGAVDELVVDVRDTGVGIPRDEQDRIFSRGFRASTSGGTRGSGIGLALVQEILKRHGCQIRVDSRPGEGSTFSFTLPLAPDDDSGEVAPQSDHPAGVQPV